MNCRNRGQHGPGFGGPRIAWLPDDSLELVLQTFVNALVQSGFFALWAVGLVLIFGVMGVIHFAHGEFVMVGAYTVWMLYSEQGWPFFGCRDGMAPLLSLVLLFIRIFVAENSPDSAISVAFAMPGWIKCHARDDLVGKESRHYGQRIG